MCDLGCGVGSLAIPLAQRGALVAASDISSSMAQEAGRRAAEMGIDTATFEASDLESVCCCGLLLLLFDYFVEWRRSCFRSSSGWVYLDKPLI